MQYRIVTIEDQSEVRKLLQFVLKEHGFMIDSFDSGHSGLEYINKNHDKIDLVLLDIGLPDINGIEICKILKSDTKFANLSIIILSAKSSEDDKVKCLNLGADDYIVKPFSCRETISRINAVLRRNTYVQQKLTKTIVTDNIRLDINTGEVFVKNKLIELTVKESALLEILMKNSEKHLSKNFLLEEVWGTSEFIEATTLKTNICRLRKKLGINAGELIKTCKCGGYMFDPTANCKN